MNLNEEDKTKVWGRIKGKDSNITDLKDLQINRNWEQN